jgi:hypothetical protein
MAYSKMDKHMFKSTRSFERGFYYGKLDGNAKGRY